MIHISENLRTLLNCGNVSSPKIKIKTGKTIFGYDDETDPEKPIENNNILSLSLHYAGASDDYPLGTANSNYVDVELWDTDRNIVFQGNEIKIYIGYKIGYSVEWINAGTFFPEKPQRSGKITSFTAYDRMKALSEVYIPSFEENTNHTIAEYLEDMANQFDFDYQDSSDAIMQTSINSDLFFTVSEDGESENKIKSGFSAQNCIAYLAGAAGCNAMFNRDDKLQLYRFSKIYSDTDIQYQISDDNTSDPSLSEHNQIIGYVACINGKVKIISESASKYNTGVSIENPLITTKVHLDSVYSLLSEDDKPFSYGVISLNHLDADITLECFDVIEYADMEGNVYQFPLMNLNFVYDGGLTCTMCSYGKTYEEVQNEVSSIQSITTDIKNLKSVSEIISQRIDEQQQILSRTSKGHALLADIRYDSTTKKYYVGSGEATTMIFSENPAESTESELKDWNEGRVIKLDYNGITVSTTGISGPYKDFALYYSEQMKKYLVNADDLAAGTLQGVKAIIDDGIIGGLTVGKWKDTNEKIHNGLMRTFNYGGYFVTFAIDSTSASTSDDFLIQMFYSDENGNAIPSEQIFCVNTKGQMYLDEVIARNFICTDEEIHVLWSGASYMKDTQTADLSEPISEQKNGIVLTFAPYISGKAQQENNIDVFVSKQTVTPNYSPYEAAKCFNLSADDFKYNACKKLHIYDDKIVGESSNSNGSRTVNGITFDNSKFVLVKVTGC